MKKYTDQLDQLITEAIIEIQNLIETKGVEGKHSRNKCLKVSEDCMFNLDGGRYLTEITKDDLVDNNGYTYSHYVLPAEKLLETFDDLIEKNKDVAEQKVK